MWHVIKQTNFERIGLQQFLEIKINPQRLPQEGPASLHLQNLDHSVWRVSEEMQSKRIMCLKPILIV